MNAHVLKTWPPEFRAVRSGIKRFEARHDDRGFEAGDALILREWDPETGEFSGEFLVLRVDYALRGRFGVPDDLCIMSISPWETWPVGTDVASKRIRDAVRSMERRGGPEC